MSGVFTILVPIATGVVAIILILGLLNLMRGGSSSRSQTLMRYRVIAQAIAVVVILMAAYLASGRN